MDMVRVTVLLICLTLGIAGPGTAQELSTAHKAEDAGIEKTSPVQGDAENGTAADAAERRTGPDETSEGVGNSPAGEVADRETPAPGAAANAERAGSGTAADRSAGARSDATDSSAVSATGEPAQPGQEPAEDVPPHGMKPETSGPTPETAKKDPPAGEAAPAAEAASTGMKKPEMETVPDRESVPAPGKEKKAGSAVTVHDAAPATDAADEGAHERPESAQPSKAVEGDDKEPGEGRGHAVADTPAKPENVTLTLATWGGAYARSQELAYFKPFSEGHGYNYKIAVYDGTYEALKAHVGSGSVEWDVINVGGGVVEKGCEEGLLNPINPSLLAAAPRPATVAADFFEGALKPCGVANAAWAAVVVYDTRAFAKNPPQSAADFFDLEAFPGKRALLEDPRHTLEFTLLADGVEPGMVYDVLATKEGQERAFAKLTSIWDQIVWSKRAAEAVDHLVQERAVMGLVFNGRAFKSIIADRQPFHIIWDGQIYAFDYWAIPKGARNASAAYEFLKFASRPDRMAAQTRWFPYGPARRSALALVGKHAEMDLDMAPFLPTHPDNFQRALAFDANWWRQHEATLTKRFEDWLAHERLIDQRKTARAAEADNGLPAVPEARPQTEQGDSTSSAPAEASSP